RGTVLGHGHDPSDRNVDMLIARLRRTIDPNPKPTRFILTEPGLGYKFAPRPQSVEDGESLPAIDLEWQKDVQSSRLNEFGLGEVKATTASDESEMQSTPDEVLIGRISNGDRLAMQVLYARYHVRVFRFVVCLVRNEATAAEVIREEV